MMIVLESFSDEKKVPNECILRVITGVVVSIPILVTTPIDESSVKRSHQETVSYTHLTLPTKRIV